MTFYSRVNRYFSSPHLGNEKLLEQLVPKGGNLAQQSRSVHLDECDLCAERVTELEMFLAFLARVLYQSPHRRGANFWRSTERNNGSHSKSA